MTNEERVAQIRAAQRSAHKFTPEEVLASLEYLLDRHKDHPWYQVGRCVYCGTCSQRLYQGTIPLDHPVYVPKKGRDRGAEMRAMWGKEW